LRGKICDACDEYSKESGMDTKKRILIIKLGAIGDVIRTTPLLVKFKKQYPDSHITWITKHPEILPQKYIDAVLKPDYNSVLLVQNSSFDIAVNLDKDKEACFLIKQADAKEKFGFSWSDNNHIIGLSEAANEKILTGLFDNYSKSNTKSYQEEIFEICGFNFKNEHNILHVDENLSGKWQIIRKESSGKKIIGLNTGCGKRWPSRMWPKDHWVSLIKLLQNSNYFPVLLGGEDEHQMNTVYFKETGSYYPGHYPVKEFIAIVNNCDLIVTAVSMSLHIAAGLGKQVVLFNNIFNKNEFELYGNGVILEPESGCDCYFGSKCSRTRHCMLDIKPIVVFEAIKNLVGAY
jgi:heptosyltransferase-2